MTPRDSGDRPDDPSVPRNAGWPPSGDDTPTSWLPRIPAAGAPDDAPTTWLPAQPAGDVEPTGTGPAPSPSQGSVPPPSDAGAAFQSEVSAHDDELGDALDLERGFGEPTPSGHDAQPAPTQALPPVPPSEDAPLRGRHRRPGDAPPPALVTPPPGQSAGPPATGDAAAPRPKQRRRAPWWELPLLVVAAVVIAILVKSFVVQPFYIPSQSMEKTLHGCPGCHGDRILVNKPIYDLRDPHPGDIVVFHAPPGWDDEPAVRPPSNPVFKVVRGFGQLVGVVPPDGLVLVKRVIATGGEAVKGDSSGHVFVSQHGTTGPWRQLDEPYVFDDGPDSHAAFGPITVPKGRLWVMGDHRNDSADSRFHCGPGGSQGTPDASCDATSSTVPVTDVIGKAVVIAWPPSRWRTLGTPATFTHVAEGLPVVEGAVVLVPLLLLRRRRRRR